MLAAKQNDFGFTLLELIVVMAIIGMVSVFVIPMLSGSFSKIEINTTLKEITATLRKARTLAVSLKTTHIFTLDREKNIYFVSTAPVPVQSQDSENITTPNQNENLFLKELKKDIVIEGFKEVDDGEISRDNLIKILFFPKGNTSGGIILVKTQDDTLISTVTIEKISGRVKIGKLNEE